MNHILIERVTHQLEILPDDVMDRILKFIAALKNLPVKGTPGIKLMKFAGILRTEDAEQMMQAIEQDCRRVDFNEW